MSTMNLATYPQNHLNGSYGQNLAYAARLLLAALLAVKPAPAKAKTGSAKQAGADLASGYDAMSPNLAAELRFMARG